MKRQSDQHRASMKALIKAKQVESGGDLKIYLLGRVYKEGDMDATPHLAKDAPAFHGTMNNPFSDSWERDDPGRPWVRANARLNKNTLDIVEHSIRNNEDDKIWGSDNIKVVTNHNS